MSKICKRIYFPTKVLLLVGVTLLLILFNTQKISASNKNDNPYQIRINRVHNTITIYARDSQGRYNIPVKAMICSVGKKGSETVLGTYNTQSKYRWKALKGNVWGQYSTRIVGGILFHSVFYYKNGDPSTLAAEEYNKLGTPASSGCVRLTVEDAKWIYDNCPVGTTVIIYDDEKNPGPLGKPVAIKLPTTAKWDPTDPSNKNPYKKKKPSIQGAMNITVPWGGNVDLLGGISAISTVGLDISDQIVVKGNVDTKIAGDYKITYSVRDALGRSDSKKVTITVEESPSKPIFKGIRDRVFPGGTKITTDLALQNVSAYDAITKQNYDIEVQIQELTKERYQILYRVITNNGKNVKISYAYFYVDELAPILRGISDRKVEPNQIVDHSFALLGVTVSDNYTVLKPSDIKITINPTSEGNYKVTYEVQDEVGNLAKETVLFWY